MMPTSTFVVLSHLELHRADTGIQKSRVQSLQALCTFRERLHIGIGTHIQLPDLNDTLPLCCLLDLPCSSFSFAHRTARQDDSRSAHPHEMPCCFFTKADLVTRWHVSYVTSWSTSKTTYIRTCDDDALAFAIVSWIFGCHEEFCNGQQLCAP